VTDTLRLAIVGDGRMGRALAALAPEARFEVVAFLGEKDVGPAGITKAMLNHADVAVEFTVPDAAAANVRGCLAAGCPVVSGTTGWDAERVRVESEVRAQQGGLVWAPNFAVGVHIFLGVAEHAARLVADANAGFDAHIVETHHKAKLDAPSGTARLLADRSARALGQTVGVTSVRTGNIPGTHELIFDAPFEQIRIEHSARDRRVFAAGALVAARWVVGRTGVFTLDHVLGIVS
jgi:4-hydroxy-tetrahydrodipicolinate reductase